LLVTRAEDLSNALVFADSNNDVVS